MRNLFYSFLVVLTCQAFADVSGVCRRVVDGDTIIVQDGQSEIKVRLIGIDAPESVHENSASKGQEFGDAAKAELEKLALGKSVVLTEEKKDLYGRTLSNVYVGDVWVNLAMVERGLAWVYDDYTKDPLLKAAEGKARDSKAGMWAGKPLPPWIWRKQQKIVKLQAEVEAELKKFENQNKGR